MGVSAPDQSQAICAPLNSRKKKRCHRETETGDIKIIFGGFVISDLHQSEEFFPRLDIFLTPFHLSLMGYKSDGNLYTFI